MLQVHVHVRTCICHTHSYNNHTQTTANYMHIHVYINAEHCGATGKDMHTTMNYVAFIRALWHIQDFGKGGGEVIF